MDFSVLLSESYEQGWRTSCSHWLCKILLALKSYAKVEWKSFEHAYNTGGTYMKWHPSQKIVLIILLQTARPLFHGYIETGLQQKSADFLQTSGHSYTSFTN